MTRDIAVRSSRPLRVFLLTLLLLAPLTHDRVFLGGNDASRFAQIEALVDHGETHIDSSRYAWTTDRVVVEGRSYSNKPPLLAVAGAGVYSLLRAIGWSFAENERVVVYLLTLLLVGVPSAWLVARFAAALAVAHPERPRVRRWLVLALASATLLLSFSVTLNGHTVAAALLFGGWTAALERRPLLAGASAALGAAVDLIPGLVFLPAIGYTAWRWAGRVGAARAAAGAAAGAVLFLALNLWVLGSPLPPLLAPGAVDQSGGKDRSGVLANIPMGRALESPGRALGAALFGSHGFLSVSPVLLAGVAGLAVASARGGGLARRGTPLPQRGALLPQSGIAMPQRGMDLEGHTAVAIGLACAVTALGHALFVGSFGGWSYGYRYLIPLVPFLLFFAPLAVPERRHRWLAALVAVSIPLALLGAYHPWPPVWEPETPTQGLEGITNPVGVNLGAWLSQHAPDATLTERMASRFISPDERVRNRYLYFFHRSKGDDAAAIEPYLDSLRRDPRRPATHYDLAEALWALDDLDGAVRHYERAIELDPASAVIRERLSAALAALGRRDASAEGAPATPRSGGGEHDAP